MKKKNVAAAALIGLLSLGQIDANATQNPEWLKKAIFYQIYPSSYMDSDGNGIGDLPGITSKLDYIKSIGCNAIWLNPVFVSGWTDGGYDVIDFYKIDPRFGTNTDMVKLCKEAHKRGIKVCLDLVAGHTSDQSPWFRQSWEAPDEQYSDYYIWTDKLSDDVKPTDIIKLKDVQGKEYGYETLIARYVEANAPRAKYYEKNFYPSQPALNYGYANPDPNHPWEQSVDAPGPQATRREMRNIMQFWFDKGVDGFRVDMAASLVKNDPDKKATIALWKEMREWINKYYPENVLISEWANPPQSIEAGFNIDFMIHFGVPGYGSLFFQPDTPNGKSVPDRGQYKHCYFEKAGLGSTEIFFKNYLNSYTKTKGKGYIAIPTANHDFQRPNIADRNTMDQLKVTQTFFMTMPGTPFIYYGDEIGMKFEMGLTPKEGSAERTGTRTPMQWTTGQNAGFSTCSPDKIFLPVDTDNGTLTVEAQEKDPNSLLNYTRELIKLRKSSSALGNTGDIEVIHENYPLIYKRFSGDEAYIVVLNPSAKAVSINIPKQGTTELVFGDKKQGTIKEGRTTDKVVAKGISALIFKIK